MTTYLIGFGAALPHRVVANAELAPRLGVEPGRIERVSGIRERRWAATDETTSALATAACAAALDDAGVDARTVDYLICGTMSPDFHVPGVAPLVQRRLEGVRPVPTLDIHVGCVALLYSLQLAHGLLTSRAASTVLCVGAEVLSKGLDLSPESAEISMLFGDGAGALVARRETGPRGGLIVEDVLVESDGAFAEALGVRSSERPSMDGRTVILHAVRRMADAANRLCERNGLRPRDVALVVPHQANANLLGAVAAKLDVDPARFVVNLDRYGNTGGASAFLALHDAWHERRPETGRPMLLLAFGAGFTWGAGLVRSDHG